MIRRAVAVAAAAAFASGCAKPVPPAWITPPSPPVFPETFYPAEVDYQLLGLVEGHACMEEDDLARYGTVEVTSLEPGAGHPAVVQAAKYDALTKAENADSLTSIRAKVSWDGTQQCVDVTGRAYRVTGIRSVAGASSTTGLTALVAVTSGPALPVARRAAAGQAKPGTIGSRGVLTIGIPGDRGVAFTAAWVKQFRSAAVELGAHADTAGDVIAPTVGVLGGFAVGNSYTFGAARFGYSIGDDEGPLLELGVGEDLLWAHWGLRVETAFDLPLSGSEPGFRASLGPTFRY